MFRLIKRGRTVCKECKVGVLLHIMDNRWSCSLCESEFIDDQQAEGLFEEKCLICKGEGKNWIDEDGKRVWQICQKCDGKGCEVQ